MKYDEIGSFLGSAAWIPRRAQDSELRSGSTALDEPRSLRPLHGRPGPATKSGERSCRSTRVVSQPGEEKLDCPDATPTPLLVPNQTLGIGFEGPDPGTQFGVIRGPIPDTA